ncbi:MAG TPA: NAD(P)/FAD-dependent oxidoreductase [Propionibacteriaceae bacterium]
MAGKRRDAVVIGAGPNGLVAANLLVDAGWDVLVVEAQDHVGGGVYSDESVAPGYVHDTFSSFYPLAGASHVIRGLELEQHGLVWRHAPAVLGNPLPDGSWAMLYRDADKTAAGLDAAAPGDGDAWRALVRDWEIIGPAILDALLSPFPPVRGGLRTLANLPRVGGLDYVRTLLEPAATMGGKRFTGEGARLLLAGNASHADIPMSASGSGLLGLLLAMMGQTVGFPLPEGGAARLTQALADRLTSRGGQIRLSTHVNAITHHNRQVTGVTTDDGEQLPARAVVADVAATVLYGDLIPWSDLPARTQKGMKRFEQDPGTIKVDWALSSPVPWSQPPPDAPGTVHFADSVDQLSQSQDAITNHSIPAEPFLLAGQMTSSDPTRSPAGTESMWAYTHVPQEVHRDEGPDGLTGRWDHDEVERMADRMQARIVKHAPDFESRIVARRVLGPYEMQAKNENLIKGALGGGTAGLHQQLIFRPVPGLGRAGTPFRGLFLGSASAHPGGGVHGACGSNAARAVLAAARTGRL